jgi:glycosyltransferase involved in cell wall biosynthesis
VTTTNTIKVLFMQSQEYEGPDAQIQASLMTHLPRDRFEVHCAVPVARHGDLSPPASVVHELADVAVRPTQFGPSLGAGDGWRSRVAAAASLAGATVSLSGLAVYVRRHRIDIVHCTEKPRDAAYGTAIARVGGAKSLIHLHVKPASWMRPMVTKAMEHADALVGVSQFVADSIVEMGYAAEKVHAVLNGLELSNWLDVEIDRDGVRHELGIDAAAPLLVTASRLFRWKGQHLIVQALPAVKARFPDVKLLIVGRVDTRAGGGADYVEELQRMVDDLDLAENVVFAGWRSDIDRLMAAADVFVMPSFEEPFGMVYVEAMALRRPVVALDNGGAREVVDQGRSGLLSPPDDVDSIADHLVRLLGDPQLRQQMGEHGRRRVIDHFSSERMTEDMAALYEQMAGTRSDAA